MSSDKAPPLIMQAQAEDRFDGLFVPYDPVFEDITSLERIVEQIACTHGASRLPRAGMNGNQLAARRAKRLVETAARRADIQAWTPSVEWMSWEMFRFWQFDIAALADAFRDHDEGDASAPFGIPCVARALVSLLEDSVRRCHAVYLQPVDGSDAAAAIKSAIAFSSEDTDEMFGPNEWVPGEKSTPHARACEHAYPFSEERPMPQFDDDANELVSQFLVNRLAFLFYRARRICIQSSHGITLHQTTLRLAERLFGSRPDHALTEPYSWDGELYVHEGVSSDDDSE